MPYVLPKIAFVNNAKTYKLLANEKRLEILNNIKYKEKCVEDLVRILGVSKANVSQHLALLRHAGIVKTRRHGQKVYYAIVDPDIIKPCVILYNLWVAGTRKHARFPAPLGKMEKVRVFARV
jgi:ArsR family transcriptional regulator